MKNKRKITTVKAVIKQKKEIKTTVQTVIREREKNREST